MGNILHILSSVAGNSVITAVIIPLIAIVIAVLGIIIPIHRNEKEKKESEQKDQQRRKELAQEKRKRMKPILSIENIDNLQKTSNIKKIDIEDDSIREDDTYFMYYLSESGLPDYSTMFYWGKLYFKNYGTEMCSIKYVKINDELYCVLQDAAICAGEVGVIMAHGCSAYFGNEEGLTDIESTSLDIVIGVEDKDGNLYEYDVSYESERVGDLLELDPMKKYNYRQIRFLKIDCSSEIVKEAECI